MKVLFVKLTSMGDLIHALPAMTDAACQIPGISFDWVIEKSFSEIAAWHPAVDQVICTAHRQWKKRPWNYCLNGEIPNFLRTLRRKKYDIIIDGQTNMKSAIVTRLACGSRHGLNRVSAREWLAPMAYQHGYFVNKNMHAITRLRLLFSEVLQYSFEETQPDFNIHHYPFPQLDFELPKRYLVFVHNASWSSKLWPKHYWRQLLQLAVEAGYHVVFPWGNEVERLRAIDISEGYSQAQVLPYCTLSQQAKILQHSCGAICSDTGLSHLAAALNIPALTLYGSTSARLIGTTGLHQQHLISSFTCTECYQVQCCFNNQKPAEPFCQLALNPKTVWQTATRLIRENP